MSVTPGFRSSPKSFRRGSARLGTAPQAGQGTMEAKESREGPCLRVHKRAIPLPCRGSATGIRDMPAQKTNQKTDQHQPKLAGNATVPHDKENQMAAHFTIAGVEITQGLQYYHS